ncbi:helix-turn-helix transcriptional regulator [Clostridium botulinum]|uniref:helix-turn-helix transcriptional regulator n=1 Tax=Clostridium botulinum TaxID=1491 RepID=UPI0002FDC60B|nr:helix-turn-helix transcriptional regulator [Clostridium botulinum]KLU74227.1 putative phage transcriptional regulator [Clostridium botulinum V891]MCD3202845.1 helix-turn-helix transcriptional regulator [Clostridium botulinum C/D]MCD3230867.1 helix-turn-helix transcriptional regulator [Clostridium botulinum C/D]MCD3253947.1 helix-turn-helix transcriptional regulator [Clostridium botulinum C/D]MCD3279457.1 helix-turn-helix transcriptional regulator [Clostridium botulinum C/D]
MLKSKSKLEEIRVKKGWSISTLSKRSNVSTKTIYRIEHNLTKPRNYILGKIANALQIKIEEVYEDE